MTHPLLVAMVTGALLAPPPGCPSLRLAASAITRIDAALLRAARNLDESNQVRRKPGRASNLVARVQRRKEIERLRGQVRGLRDQYQRLLPGVEVVALRLRLTRRLARERWVSDTVASSRKSTAHDAEIENASTMARLITSLVSELDLRILAAGLVERLIGAESEHLRVSIHTDIGRIAVRQEPRPPGSDEPLRVAPLLEALLGGMPLDLCSPDSPPRGTSLPGGIREGRR